jgi:DNA-binding transcriptional MerR regulator
MTYLTPDAARMAGLSTSHINTLVRRGVITPAAQARGRGDYNRFDAVDIKRLRAYAVIREQLGDGRAAHALVSQILPTITASTQFVEILVEQTVAV